MAQREFYIILPSNVKSHSSFQYNTISSYRTKLMKRISFPKEEDWSVGLSEISYTKSWYNIQSKSHIKFFDVRGLNLIHRKTFDSATESYIQDSIADEDEMKDQNDGRFIKSAVELKTEEIKVGFYRNIEELVQEINSKFVELSLKYKFKQVPRIIFDKISQKVRITCGKLNEQLFFPEFEEELESILGLRDENEMTFKEKCAFIYDINQRSFDDEEKTSEIWRAFALNEYIESKRVVELNSNFRSLYIYSDIVDHSLVGDTYAQLLRTVHVPSESVFSQNITTIYDNPHLIPLLNRTFDSIKVELRDDSGQLIPFESGRVKLKLYFKKND